MIKKIKNRTTLNFKVRKMHKERKINTKCKQDKNMTREKLFKKKRKGKNNKNKSR
jgi:hypothetical protein